MLVSRSHESTVEISKIVKLDGLSDLLATNVKKLLGSAILNVLGSFAC